MGWYLRNWAVYEFDFYLSEFSIKNPNFWYMSRVTAFKTEMRLLVISTGVLHTIEVEFLGLVLTFGTNFSIPIWNLKLG